MALKLHVGTHKTGTTLIQHFAHQNRERLRDAGLEYPDWREWLDVRSHYGHHDLAHAVAANSRHLGYDELERFWAILRDYARDNDVLVSAEPVYRYLLPGDPNPKQPRVNYLQRLGEWAWDVETEVIMVFRRPDDFAASLYGEHVLQTRFGGDIERFIREKRYLFNYAQQIRLFERHVGRVRHLCYEALKSQGLLSAFFRELGIDVASWDHPEVVNSSKDAALVEIKRRANSSGVTANENKAYLRRLEGTRVADVLGDEEASRPRSVWYSREQEQAFRDWALERFAASSYWDEGKYASWRGEPYSAKSYMGDWLDDLQEGLEEGLQDDSPNEESA